MTKERATARSEATKQPPSAEAQGTTSRLNLPFGHPALLLATWFGAGLLPWTPGTWGSLAALPCAWAIRLLWGDPGLAAAAVLVFALGCWAASVAAAASGRDDPGAIVIDEVAAQFLALLAAPADWRGYAAAFVLFRLFDIWKPFPIRRVERSVPGGLGIMLDDVLAAVYAMIVLLLAGGALGVRP